MHIDHRDSRKLLQDRSHRQPAGMTARQIPLERRVNRHVVGNERVLVLPSLFANKVGTLKQIFRSSIARPADSSVYGSSGNMRKRNHASLPLLTSHSARVLRARRMLFHVEKLVAGEEHLAEAGQGLGGCLVGREIGLAVEVLLLVEMGL